MKCSLASNQKCKENIRVKCRVCTDIIHVICKEVIYTDTYAAL